MLCPRACISTGGGAEVSRARVATPRGPRTGTWGSGRPSRARTWRLSARGGWSRGVPVLCHRPTFPTRDSQRRPLRPSTPLPSEGLQTESRAKVMGAGPRSPLPRTLKCPPSRRLRAT